MAEQDITDVDRVPLVASIPDFGSFYRREYAGVATLTMVLTRSRSAAEDLAQEAFLRAHRDWADIANHENPEAWVRRVAINLAMSHFRRLRAEARAVLRIGGRSAFIDMNPEALEFWAVVRKLPSRQAQVVALRYVEDLAVADIANTLGISEGSVKTHLHRARETLARRFGTRAEAP